MDNSPFSKLTAKVRNQIYELVLCPPGGIQVGLVDGTTDAAAVRIVHPPPAQKICSLTATCKAIREECHSMLYDSNTYQMKALALSTDTFQPGSLKENAVRVEEYVEFFTKVRQVLPLVRRIRIDLGVWRWPRYFHPEGDQDRFWFLAELRYALRFSVPDSMRESTSLLALFTIDVNELDPCRILPGQNAPQAPITFEFDPMKINLGVEQKFRTERQKLEESRNEGTITPRQYAMAFMRIHKYQQGIRPMFAHITTIDPVFRWKFSGVTDKRISSSRESPHPGMTNDVATAAGNSQALTARVNGIELT
ncbi:hypothetical protein NU195Hw_g368t1 [Hortaea werneckii]